MLERSVSHGESKGIMAYQSLWMAYLSEVYLGAGRVDDAARLAQRALALSREHRERGHEAWTLRLLGELHAARAPVDLAAARSALGQALALGEELGMRPLAAHCRLGLGRVARRAGDRGTGARRSGRGDRPLRRAGHARLGRAGARGGRARLTRAAIAPPPTRRAVSA